MSLLTLLNLIFYPPWALICLRAETKCEPIKVNDSKQQKSTVAESRTSAAMEITTPDNLWSKVRRILQFLLTNRKIRTENVVMIFGMQELQKRVSLGCARQRTRCRCSPVGWNVSAAPLASSNRRTETRQWVLMLPGHTVYPPSSFPKLLLGAGGSAFVSIVHAPCGSLGSGCIPVFKSGNAVCMCVHT